MRILLANKENVHVNCAIPYEHMKVLVEAFKRGYITDAILPCEAYGCMKTISISEIDTAATFAHIYAMAYNNDRQQLEALGMRRSEPPDQGTVCELGGGK